MPFALSSDPSQSEISDAINYLLCNFGSNVSIDVNTGIVAGPTGNLGYLYKYLFIKYATASDGSSGFSNVPTGATYFGTRNSNSSTESTNPTDYVWTQVTGGFGTTKFIWYSTNGGRQINTVVSVSSPGLSYLVDPGTAIDLDVVTGTNALMAAIPAIYQWTSGSAPARPTTTSTYTWATGSFTPPSGWSASIPSDTTAGDTLWAIYISLVVLANTATSTLDWTNTSYSIVQIAKNGSTGTTGATGLSSFTAYLVQSQSSSAPSTPANTTGPTAPSGWSLTAPSVSVGQVLWYSFGQYNGSSGTINGIPAGQTQWGSPTAASVFQDIRSDNWNGSNPPTPGTPSTYGTSGYYISRTNGSMWLNSIYGRGIAQFDGSNTGTSGVTAAILANYSLGQNAGVEAYTNNTFLTSGALRGFNSSGSTGNAIYGYQNSTGNGVVGQSSSGTGVSGVGTYGVQGTGTYGVYSNGPFGTSTNSLVTNLYAQYTLNLKRQGSGSGDLYFYTGPTTGASVATFNATNKPGATNSTNQWIEVVINGASYQIPIWAS